MNLQDIVKTISQQEGIPAGRVRKVVIALLDHFGSAIDSGEKVTLPGFVFNPRTLPAKGGDGGEPYAPERKIAVLRRKFTQSN